MEGARPAVRDDAEACAELCRRAMDEIERLRGGDMLLRSDAGSVLRAVAQPGGLDGLLAAPRTLVLVGTIDDAVVGMAVGHLDEAGKPALGVVDGCYVEPEARGVGVGRALLDGLTAWFVSSSCGGVDVTALPGDRRSKNFFEAAGFKARLITMHRRPQ